MSVQKKERHISRTTQIAHPRPTYTDPPLGVRWGVEYGGELIITNATVCSPHLSSYWVSTNMREGAHITFMASKKPAGSSKK